jgi:amidase
MEFDLEEATIADLRSRLESGESTAVDLAATYLERIEAIDRGGIRLGSVIEVNPDTEEIASRLDDERREGRSRGPLHGVPILIKDNLDTADRMMTTSGSLALVGHHAKRDATVVRALREAGAVIIGKLNQSEWANFRSPHSTSGWSGRGGQCRNPYALDRTPWGSSGGSGAAASANLAAATIGTETDGSIVLPAAANGVVGIKPTVGLTSRAGVIPISRSQDTVGPLGRTVADAAALLSAIVTGADALDPGTSGSAGKAGIDYTRFLDPRGLAGARIGVARKVYFGYSEKADAIVEEAIRAMRELGAEVVDPADLPHADQLTFLGTELTVLHYEFKALLNKYLSGVGPELPVHSLADVIAFNEQHAADELRYFGQETMLAAEAKGSLDELEYRAALAHNHRISRTEGIDAVMDEHRLDALVMPTCTAAWKIDYVLGDHIQGMGTSPAAMAGYPLVSVPAGFVQEMPVGLLFTGRAYSEGTLIRLAFAFEQATKHRRPPRFLPEVPEDTPIRYQATALQRG